jgi:hypothetical protein
LLRESIYTDSYALARTKKLVELGHMFHVCASLYLKRGEKDENLLRTTNRLLLCRGKGTKLEFAPFFCIF